MEGMKDYLPEGFTWFRLPDQIKELSDKVTVLEETPTVIPTLQQVTDTSADTTNTIQVTSGNNVNSFVAINGTKYGTLGFSNFGFPEFTLYDGAIITTYFSSQGGLSYILGNLSIGKNTGGALFEVAGTAQFDDNITVDGTVKTAGYTVATLPTGVIGKRAYVTDATAPTYLGVLTGGGAITCPVFYNGTAWVSA